MKDRSYYSSHYKDICRIALRAGEVMASHGAEAYRIEDTVCRILGTTGFEYIEAYVSVTGLILTLSDKSLDQEVTLTKRISNRGSDLSQISLANDISRHFVEGELSIEEAETLLNELHGKKNYSWGIQLLCYGLTSGIFCLMFGGMPLDALSSALIGLFFGAIGLGLKKLHLAAFMWNFLCSVLLGLAFVFIYSLFGQHLNPGPILSGAIMPLVPGMLLTVAIRDLLKGDYMSGVSRGIEAVITALSIAAGMSIVMRLFDSSAGALSLESPSRWLGDSLLLYLPFQALCSFLSTVSFVVLFDAERKHLVPCGIAGAFTWLIYCLFTEFRLSGIALFLSAFGASILAFIFARTKKAPVTVFFTGGILCLVPGAGIFQTMYYLVGRHIAEGSEQLLTTLETAGLIAIAMAVATFIFMLMIPKKK